MKISWNFAERWGALLLCKAVPSGSLKNMRIIRDGSKILKVTEKDVEKVKLQHKNGEAVWDTQEGEKKQDFNLDEQFIKLLKEKIKELDKKNAIPGTLLPLAEVLGL